MNLVFLKYNEWITRKLYVKLWAKEGLIYNTHNSFMIASNIRTQHEIEHLNNITNQLHNLNIEYQILHTPYSMKIIMLNNDNDLTMAKLIS